MKINTNEEQGKKGIKSLIELTQDKSFCLECKKGFIQDVDIQLCENCMKLFDLEKLWKMHDLNKLDALDFNENESLREKFRISKHKQIEKEVLRSIRE